VRRAFSLVFPSRFFVAVRVSSLARASFRRVNVRVRRRGLELVVPERNSAFAQRFLAKRVGDERERSLSVVL
jgi:hypothetical protein